MGGEHPTNQIGPKKLSRTVADLDARPTRWCFLGACLFVLFLSFFLPWVANTQLDRWTKRFVCVFVYYNCHNVYPPSTAGTLTGGAQ